MLIKDRSVMATDRSEKVEQLSDIAVWPHNLESGYAQKIKKQNICGACGTVQSNVEPDVYTHLRPIII
jgi:hypothetical protein